MRRPASKAIARHATNVRSRSDLLAAARKAGINLSAALERALEEKLSEVKRKKWREENREAIAAYNEHVEKHGMFSDGIRPSLRKAGSPRPAYR